MSTAMLGRHRAPIDYQVVKRPHNIARAVGGAFMTLASVYATLALGHTTAWAGAVGAIVILVDALVCLSRPAAPNRVLLVDITTVGFVWLLIGASPAAQATGIIYVMVAAFLLVPLTTAGILIGYSLTWVVVVLLVAARNDGAGLLGPSEAADVTAAVDALMATVIVGVIAVLLIGAVRALLDAQDQSRTALDLERRAAKLKDEFVSMVSHELRTPLTGITGFTDTLRDSWRSLPPGEVDEFLTIMRDESEHLADLVEDILVIPRLEAGYLRLNPEELDVVAATVDAADLLLAGVRDYEVSLTGPVMVIADPVRLKQVLRNLLGNALKYGGDQILLEGRHYGSNEYLVVVSDNGPGVADEDTDRIFDHFEQVSSGDARLEQGVGLGLPIARKLTRAMGGELWYEARFPVGSHFCFTLPLARSRVDDADQEMATISTIG